MTLPDSQPHQVAAPTWGSTPIPDPTTLTREAVERSEKALVSYIDGKFDLIMTRLSGQDEATRLRLERIDHVPDQIDTRVATLAGLTTERFLAVAQQFALNKVALEAAFSASKEAVSAALLAQQQAAARQDESNQKSIDKSEVATEKRIDTNLTLTRATTDALTKSLDELKTRVTSIESGRQGMVEQRTEGRQSSAAVYAAIAAVTGLILFVVVVVGVLIEANR